MAKKRKSAPTATILDLIRSSTHYAGSRSFLGAPFLAVGFLLVLATGYLLFRQFYLVAAGTFFSAMFLFSVAEIGKAVFDMADCAALAEARARARDAREARETYRENEVVY